MNHKFVFLKLHQTHMRYQRHCSTTNKIIVASLAFIHTDLVFSLRLHAILATKALSCISLRAMLRQLRLVVKAKSTLHGWRVSTIMLQVQLPGTIASSPGSPLFLCTLKRGEPGI